LTDPNFVTPAITVSQEPMLKTKLTSSAPWDTSVPVAPSCRLRAPMASTPRLELAVKTIVSTVSLDTIVFVELAQLTCSTAPKVTTVQVVRWSPMRALRELTTTG